MIAKFESHCFTDYAHISVHKYKNLHNLTHWHMEHELIYVYSGSVTLMTENNLYTLTEGMCAFIRSEEVHYIKGDAESITNVIKFDSAYAKSIVGHKRLVSPLLANTYPVIDIYERIANEFKNKNEYNGIVADSLGLILLAQIFRSEETCEKNKAQGKISQKYKDLLEFISGGYSHITFDDAASYMNFSKPYFSKYFRRFSGMTFTDYLNILKVSAAVDKINDGKMSMTEISIACGFGTIRNFNRIFKKLTGHSPKQLPDDYTFIYNLKEISDIGFNPTLNCTEIIE